jgi:RsiW-degrading membrane proteinase PrsW (M82 family)
MLAAAVGLGQHVAGTPAVVVAAALVPALGFAGLVLLVDRGAPEPWPALATGFLWGATVGALAALAVNETALGMAGDAAGGRLVPTVVAPAVEEVSKASALAVVALVWRRAFAGVRDGVVYGALAGLGFAATENVGYHLLAAVEGGMPGLGRALYVRGLLQGLNHAAFTATVGAAVGHALVHRGSGTGRVGVVLGGLGVATVLHALWNAVAAEAITHILCNAPAGGGACAPAPDPLDLVMTVPMMVAVFVGPLVAVLASLALRAREAEPGGRMSREH